MTLTWITLSMHEKENVTFSSHSLIKLLFSIFELKRAIRNDYFLCITEHCRGQGFESRTSLNCFQAYIRNCISCVYNCDDLPSNNSLQHCCNIVLNSSTLFQHCCPNNRRCKSSHVTKP